MLPVTCTRLVWVFGVIIIPCVQQYTFYLKIGVFCPRSILVLISSLITPCLFMYGLSFELGSLGCYFLFCLRRRGEFPFVKFPLVRHAASVTDGFTVDTCISYVYTDTATLVSDYPVSQLFTGYV